MGKRIISFLLGLVSFTIGWAQTNDFDHFPSQNCMVIQEEDRTDTARIENVFVYPTYMLTENRKHLFEDIKVISSRWQRGYEYFNFKYSDKAFIIQLSPIHQMGNVLLPNAECSYRVLKDNRIQIIGIFNYKHPQFTMYLTLNPTNEQQKNLEIQYQQFKQDIFSFDEELSEYTNTYERIDYNTSTIYLKYKKLDSRILNYDTELLNTYKRFKEKGFVLKQRIQENGEEFILTHGNLNGELHFQYRPSTKELAISIKYGD